MGHLIIFLLSIPFMLVHLVMTLVGMAIHFFMHIMIIPLRFFARHTLLCIVIAIVLILYFAIKKDPHSVDSLKPTPVAEKQAKDLPKGAIPVIEPVMKKEDGDSIFATDTYQIMNDMERKVYSQNYYTIMSTVPDGQAQEWNYYNIQGSIRPISSFNNKLGQACRTFTEVLKVHTIQQTISGTACDNGGGTWCKLKPNATPQCGLGHEAGTFEGLGNAIRNLF